jgi:NADH:ubiquinone oxidoreductase subunit 5 (subunit L)/multisubunit Na+/H+ antiporter MnhA subunit
MSYYGVLQALGLGVVACPVMLFAALSIAALAGKPLGEHLIARLTQAAVVAGLVCSVAVLGLMLITGERYVPVELGDWVNLHEEHFHFHIKFVFDRLSVPFVILSFVLVGTIGAFATHYMHREPGYSRFFLLYALFLVGMIVASLAGTIEVLFLGWELVGLSSALLVAFFHERQAPVINGQRVWSVYRVADAAFLVAALTLHHLTGGGEFSKLMGSEPWPEGVAAMTSNQALFVGLLLLIAAAGKSALIPFSGWLPRAMEGPTPSSAVFYGALSVHLGTYLLLRVEPVLYASPLLSAVVVLLGVATAVYAGLVTRVLADVKTNLAFASLTQVGIITAEIGLAGLLQRVFHSADGWLVIGRDIGAALPYIALIHIIGHACLRTLQLVRAPSLLQDYHLLENAIGDHLRTQPSAWERMIPLRGRLAIYRLAFERGYLDAIIDQFITRPFIRLFRWCDAMERRWTDVLSGTQSRESDLVPAAVPEPAGEELA